MSSTLFCIYTVAPVVSPPTRLLTSTHGQMVPNLISLKWISFRSCELTFLPSCWIFRNALSKPQTHHVINLIPFLHQKILTWLSNCSLILELTWFFPFQSVLWKLPPKSYKFYFLIFSLCLASILALLPSVSSCLHLQCTMLLDKSFLITSNNVNHKHLRISYVIQWETPLPYHILIIPVVGAKNLHFYCGKEGNSILLKEILHLKTKLWTSTEAHQTFTPRFWIICLSKAAKCSPTCFPHLAFYFLHQRSSNRPFQPGLSLFPSK
jgi:hypothetical protein